MVLEHKGLHCALLSVGNVLGSTEALLGPTIAKETLLPLLTVSAWPSRRRSETSTSDAHMGTATGSQSSISPYFLDETLTCSCRQSAKHAWCSAGCWYLCAAKAARTGGITRRGPEENFNYLNCRVPDAGVHCTRPRSSLFPTGLCLKLLASLPNSST